jgi:hypothetical protein
MDGDDEQGYGLWMAQGGRRISGGGPPFPQAQYNLYDRD